MKKVFDVSVMLVVVALTACSAPHGDGRVAPAAQPRGQATGDLPITPAGMPAKRAIEATPPSRHVGEEAVAVADPNQPDNRGPSDSSFGPLPLQRGVYVAEGSGCASPANAAVRIYNGTGISGSSTRDCRATVRLHQGNRYEVDESCENTYDGTRTSEVQSLTIFNEQHFLFRTVSYRRCAAGAAPAELERLAR